MIKRKQIISKLLATTMCVSTFTSSVSAATVSSTTLAGADRYETAVKVSESGWTSATNAIIINGDKGLVDALTATPYASLKNAPILVTEKDKLTTTTKNRLEALGVKNVDIIGGEAVVSKAVEDELKAMGLTVNRIYGEDRYLTSVAVANEIKKLTTVNKIAVVNGATGLPDAVSIAAPAADNKMPILLSDPTNNKGIAQAQSFISSNNISKSYVIGQTNAVSDSIMNSLPGTKVRLGGDDRHDTNAKVIKEFYTSTSLDNIYVAKSGYVKNNEELVDALAVGVLAAKNDDPVLIVGNNLGDSQEDLLSSKTFTKITQVGNGIPSDSIQEIKDTQKDSEAKVTSITLVDYKTIKISGTELDRLSESNITLSGNTVASYTCNTAGTQATIVFNSGFSSGTNTLKVTSNLGNTTSHTFTYTSAISSVEATTKEIALNGVQYLEFTVNGGQTKTVEELEALGWEVEFESTDNVFYSEKDPTTALKTSTTGKLMTSGFTENQVFSYKVTLTKGSTVITTSENRFVTAKASTATNIVSIDSYDVKFKDTDGENRDLISNKLLVGETITISNIKGTQKDGKEEVDITANSEITTSDSKVLTISGNKITARKVGSAEITITNGDTTETISIKVVDASANTRVVKSVKFYLDDTLKSSIRLTKGSTTSTELTVKAFDQFGDPINTTINDVSSTLATSSKTIANVNISSTFTGNGESTLTLTPVEIGSTTLKLQITHSGSTTATTLGSLSVSVAEATSKETYTLTRVGGSSEDLTLDRYDYKNDDDVILQLNAYDSNGNLIGGKDMTATDQDEYEYILKYDSDLVEASMDNGTDGKITVKPASGKTKTGTSTVAVYKQNKSTSKQTLVKSVSIKVTDTTPVLSSVTMNSIATITEVNKKENEFNLTELFDISYEKLTNASGKNEKDNEAYYKKIVGNVTVSGYPNQEVLMSTSESACTVSGGEAILFIDRDTDGQYGSEDFILATLKIELDTVTGSKTNGGVKLNSDTENGKIIVGRYNGKYSSSKSPTDTVITVKINN